jgi:hypothetical protein
LRKLFIIFLKKSTKNEKFMIFQAALRKYVGIYEQSESGYFFSFYPQISIKKSEKILDEKPGKFS